MSFSPEVSQDSRVVLLLRKMVFLFWFFYSLPVFVKMVEKWRLDNYEYCFLVLPVSFYLLFNEWKKGNLFVSSPELKKAFLFFVLGLMSFVVGFAVSFSFLLFLSVWFFFYVCFFLVFGESTKNVYFPLFLLLLSVPLPPFVERTLTFKLQLLTSALASFFLEVIGIPAFRSGNIIDLGFTKLQVAEACSGLRYVLPLLFLAVIMGFFRLKGEMKVLKTLLLSVAVIPIVILVNALRIVLTALFEARGYHALIHGFWHEVLGIVLFVLSLVLLLGVVYILERTFHNTSKVQRDETKSETVGVLVLAVEKGGIRKEVTFSIAVMSILFCCALLLMKDTVTRAEVAGNSTLYFPSEVDGWIGVRQYFSPAVLKSLRADAYISYSFRKKEKYSGVLHLLVSYYRNQTPGRTPHTPTSCILGTGWEIKARGAIALPFGDETVVFNYMILKKGNRKALSLYTFAVRGKFVSSQLLFRWYSLLDKIRRGRSAALLFRLEYVSDEETPVSAMEEAVKDFLKHSYPEFKRLLELTEL